MVAVIKSGYALSRAVGYNEMKVSEGVAQNLAAVNYPLDTALMDGKMKLFVLKDRAALNGRTGRNSVHISLNFDPSEKDYLDNGRLLEIVQDYMLRIGFSAQPYLVYRHHDAAHPHVHIVTTNIRGDGSRIGLHNIGKLKSEPARKAIEKKFGLVRAEDQRRHGFSVKPVDVSKVIYGKNTTRRAIGNVLETVLGKYRYGSLAELNAVLRQFNVMAQRGDEGSRTYKNRGLLYRVLDAHGNPVGVPIKASLFYNKPGLDFLERKFEAGKAKPIRDRNRIKGLVDLALSGKAPGLDGLVAALKKQGVDVVLRRSDTGLIYGITYVDHVSKCVWNGSALGKSYSAKAVQQRCLKTAGRGQDAQPHPAPAREGRLPSRPGAATGTDAFPVAPEMLIDHPEIFDVIGELFGYTYSSDYVPYELTGKKKKRRKRKRKKLDG